MAILTYIVIATLIIVGAYVGQAAWEKSLHEEPDAHSIPIELETYQTEEFQSLILVKSDPSTLIG